MTTTKYDYSMYDGIERTWDYDILKDKHFFGLHEVDGRIEIDVARYKIACKVVGIDDFLPSSIFNDSSIEYYIPTRKTRADYIVNIYVDSLNELLTDWNQEYKQIFKKITTPEEVRQGYRTNMMMYTSNVDDLDEIDVDAALASVRRISTYNRIINELYCIFISKICTEVDRISLFAMTSAGYSDTDFSFKQFRAFSEGLIKDKAKYKIEKLEKYNAYNMLHKINNFLKHNSIDSYNTLKKFYPNSVMSIENGKTDRKYENGMFASDWIIIKENYIDEVLNKLKSFFIDYCKKFFNEDFDTAQWDNDDYFLNAVWQMKDPKEYFGLYF